MTHVRTLTSILLLWVLISAGVSFNNAVRDNNNIYSQLHAVPYDSMKTGYNNSYDAMAVDLGDAPPAQYWTMDWIMSPMRISTSMGAAWVGAAVARDLCSTGDATCNPLWWQTDQGCRKDWMAAAPVEVQDEQAYFYKTKKTKFRHLQPLFTCLAEKIGNVNLYLNNEHSYSIGSTHNINVLVTGVFFTWAVILMTMMLTTVGKADGLSTADQKARRMLLNAVVLVVIVMTYLWASGVSMDPTKDQHRPIGMASYAYTAVYLLLTLLIFNQPGVWRDHRDERRRMKQDKINKKEERDSVASGKTVTARLDFDSDPKTPREQAYATSFSSYPVSLISYKFRKGWLHRWQFATVLASAGLTSWLIIGILTSRQWCRT